MINKAKKNLTFACETTITQNKLFLRIIISEHCMEYILEKIIIVDVCHYEWVELNAKWAWVV